MTSVTGNCLSVCEIGQKHKCSLRVMEARMPKRLNMQLLQKNSHKKVIVFCIYVQLKMFLC